MKALLVAGVMLLSLASCAEAGSVSNCSSVSDCDIGQVCAGGACIQACNVDADCPGEVCRGGICASADVCTVNEDCRLPRACEVASGAQCVAGRCEYPLRTCDTPPADSCDETDSLFRTFETVGTCNPADGGCEYNVVESSCPSCSTVCLQRCAALDCTPANDCVTNGICIPEDPARCEFTLATNGASCTLGAGTGLCSSGTCVECITSSDCDDSNACTADSCNAQACVFMPNVTSGTPCDDGDDCTHTDTCDGAGSCGGTSITCSNAGTTCGPARACNGTPVCTEVFPDTSTSCDDGSACSPTESCDGVGNCAPDSVLSGSFTGDYTISSPSDVAILNCYTFVTGNVVVDPSTTATTILVTQLGGIGGDLLIVGTPTVDFEASLLSSVGGSISVDRNSLLTRLSLPSLQSTTTVSIGNGGSIMNGGPGNPLLGTLDLSALQSLNDALFVGGLFSASNDSLLSISLPNLEGADVISIINNDALTTIDLSALTSVNTNLTIFTSPMLTSVDVSAATRLQAIGVLGAQNLTTLDFALLARVDADISLLGTALTTLNGFGSLNFVGNSLGLTSNPSLNNLSALSSVTSLDELLITDNAVLDNLTGLGSLSTVSDSLVITSNPMLPCTDATDLESQLSSPPATSTISGNMGCP